MPLFREGLPDYETLDDVMDAMLRPLNEIVVKTHINWLASRLETKLKKLQKDRTGTRRMMAAYPHCYAVFPVQNEKVGQKGQAKATAQASPCHRCASEPYRIYPDAEMKVRRELRKIESVHYQDIRELAELEEGLSDTLDPRIAADFMSTGARMSRLSTVERVLEEEDETCECTEENIEAEPHAIDPETEEAMEDSEETIEIVEGNVEAEHTIDAETLGTRRILGMELALVDKIGLLLEKMQIEHLGPHLAGGCSTTLDAYSKA